MLKVNEKLYDNIRDYFKCYQKSSLQNKELSNDFAENWIDLLKIINKGFNEEAEPLLKVVFGFFRDDKLVDGAKALQFQAGYDYFLFYSRNLGGEKKNVF